MINQQEKQKRANGQRSESDRNLIEQLLNQEKEFYQDLVISYRMSQIKLAANKINMSLTMSQLPQTEFVTAAFDLLQAVHYDLPYDKPKQAKEMFKWVQNSSKTALSSEAVFQEQEEVMMLFVYGLVELLFGEANEELQTQIGKDVLAALTSQKDKRLINKLTAVCYVNQDPSEWFSALSERDVTELEKILMLVVKKASSLRLNWWQRGLFSLMSKAAKVMFQDRVKMERTEYINMDNQLPLSHFLAVVSIQGLLHWNESNDAQGVPRSWEVLASTLEFPRSQKEDFVAKGQAALVLLVDQAQELDLHATLYSDDSMLYERPVVVYRRAKELAQELKQKLIPLFGSYASWSMDEVKFSATAEGMVAHNPTDYRRMKGWPQHFFSIVAVKDHQAHSAVHSLMDMAGELPGPLDMAALSKMQNIKTAFERTQAIMDTLVFDDPDVHADWEGWYGVFRLKTDELISKVFSDERQITFIDERYLRLNSDWPDSAQHGSSESLHRNQQQKK